MGKINGKAKGNGFERKIANLLSETFKDYLGISNGFRRNPDSGSYFGGSNIDRTLTHSLDYAIFGDLICPRNFKYSIECKHYKTAPSLQALINQSVKQWDTWLEQAEQDSKASNKEFSLIVKYNNVDELIFLKNTLTGFKSSIQYKQYHIYKLIEFLSFQANFYFSQDQNPTSPLGQTNIADQKTA